MAKSLHIRGRKKRAGSATPTEPPAYMARSSPIEPLAYSPPNAAKAAGIGKDGVYAAIRSGTLVAPKYRKRTLVLRSDLVDWLASLPLYSEESHDGK